MVAPKLAVPVSSFSSVGGSKWVNVYSQLVENCKNLGIKSVTIRNLSNEAIFGIRIRYQDAWANEIKEETHRLHIRKTVNIMVEDILDLDMYAENQVVCKLSRVKKVEETSWQDVAFLDILNTTNGEVSDKIPFSSKIARVWTDERTRENLVISTPAIPKDGGSLITRNEIFSNPVFDDEKRTRKTSHLRGIGQKDWHTIAGRGWCIVNDGGGSRSAPTSTGSYSVRPFDGSSQQDNKSSFPAVSHPSIWGLGGRSWYSVSSWYQNGYILPNGDITQSDNTFKPMVFIESSLRYLDKIKVWNFQKHTRVSETEEQRKCLVESPDIGDQIDDLYLSELNSIVKTPNLKINQSSYQFWVAPDYIDVDTIYSVFFDLKVSSNSMEDVCHLVFTAPTVTGLSFYPDKIVTHLRDRDTTFLMDTAKVLSEGQYRIGIIYNDNYTDLYINGVKQEVKQQLSVILTEIEVYAVGLKVEEGVATNSDKFPVVKFNDDRDVAGQPIGLDDLSVELGNLCIGGKFMNQSDVDFDFEFAKMWRDYKGQEPMTSNLQYFNNIKEKIKALTKLDQEGGGSESSSPGQIVGGVGGIEGSGIFAYGVYTIPFRNFNIKMNEIDWDKTGEKQTFVDFPRVPKNAKEVKVPRAKTVNSPTRFFELNHITGFGKQCIEINFKKSPAFNGIINVNKKHSASERFIMSMTLTKEGNWNSNLNTINGGTTDFVHNSDVIIPAGFFFNYKPFTFKANAGEEGSGKFFEITNRNSKPICSNKNINYVQSNLDGERTGKNGIMAVSMALPDWYGLLLAGYPDKRDDGGPVAMTSESCYPRFHSVSWNVGQENLNDKGLANYNYSAPEITVRMTNTTITTVVRQTSTPSNSHYKGPIITVPDAMPSEVSKLKRFAKVSYNGKEPEIPVGFFYDHFSSYRRDQMIFPVKSNAFSYFNKAYTTIVTGYTLVQPYVAHPNTGCFMSRFGRGTRPVGKDPTYLDNVEMVNATSGICAFSSFFYSETDQKFNFYRFENAEGDKWSDVGGEGGSRVPILYATKERKNENKPNGVWYSLGFNWYGRADIITFRSLREGKSIGAGISTKLVSAVAEVVGECEIVRALRLFAKDDYSGSDGVGKSYGAISSIIRDYYRGGNSDRLSKLVIRSHREPNDEMKNYSNIHESNVEAWFEDQGGVYGYFYIEGSLTVHHHSVTYKAEEGVFRFNLDAGSKKFFDEKVLLKLLDPDATFDDPVSVTDDMPPIYDGGR